MRLSERQWYVLKEAYDNSKRFQGVTTSRCGKLSIAANTCKSLEKLGLLRESSSKRGEYFITSKGAEIIEALARRNLLYSLNLPKNPQEQLQQWNAKVRGKA